MTRLEAVERTRRVARLVPASQRWVRGRVHAAAVRALLAAVRERDGGEAEAVPEEALHDPGPW